MTLYRDFLRVAIASSCTLPYSRSLVGRSQGNCIRSDHVFHVIPRLNRENSQAIEFPYQPEAVTPIRMYMWSECVEQDFVAVPKIACGGRGCQR
jgi:hypothetical protein